MLKHSRVRVQRKKREERIGTEYNSGRNIAIVFVVLALVTLAIVLPLVLIDSDDDSTNTNTTASGSGNSAINTESVLKIPTIADAPIMNLTPQPGEATFTIQMPFYTEFYHPLYNGPKVFREDHFNNGCPHGPGLSVLFGRQECEPLCNSLNGCIGFNFDTVQNLCTFFTSNQCVENFMSPVNDHTVSYLKNIHP